MMPFFQQVMKWAKANQEPYLWRAYLLAVPSRQPLTDIGGLRFRDIKRMDFGEYLAIQQVKTGTKVMIPLELSLPDLGLTAHDFITQCRDHVVSPYLFHHIRHVGQTKCAPNPTATVLAVRAVRPNWGENDPLSFHELRSLAEREYDAFGIDTQNSSAINTKPWPKPTPTYAAKHGSSRRWLR